jgi:hypothetical protein
MARRRLGDPDEDDTSPRADLLRATHDVEREKICAKLVVLALALTWVWFFEEIRALTYVAIAGLVTLLLIGIYGQLCAMRVDALRREMRSLPPRR